MTPDEYLQRILRRESVDTGPFSPVRGVQRTVQPIIAQWAGRYLLGASPSGSFAKGTANSSGTDIDLFISLSPNTPETLREIYNKLFSTMKANGYTPRRQNVSINVNVNGYQVDLVPGKCQAVRTSDHSLYRRKADSWTKTNVATHIAHVIAGGRISESRIIKLWRNQNELDFPSFYLELTVIAALFRCRGSLSSNVLKVFEYLSDGFERARVVDPANTNNIISNDLTVAERGAIARAASLALVAEYWEHIVV